jgi:hypothetical protein
MIKIIYTGSDSKKLEKEAIKAFDFVSKIFLIKLPKITVRIYASRAEFNKYLGKETPDWHVANASNNNEIAILSPLAMTKESNHKSDEFLPILKHEFAHIFIYNTSKGKSVPKWLNEGFANYIARQNQVLNRSIYIADNFIQQIDTPKNWDENVNYDAYNIAALFFRFLVNKYSMAKIIKLLQSIDKHYYYPNFEKTFHEIYGVNLSEVGKEFIKNIND